MSKTKRISPALIQRAANVGLMIDPGTEAHWIHNIQKWKSVSWIRAEILRRVNASL